MTWACFNDGCEHHLYSAEKKMLPRPQASARLKPAGAQRVWKPLASGTAPPRAESALRAARQSCGSSTQLCITPLALDLLLYPATQRR